MGGTSKSSIALLVDQFLDSTVSATSEEVHHTVGCLDCLRDSAVQCGSDDCWSVSNEVVPTHWFATARKQAFKDVNHLGRRGLSDGLEAFTNEAA